MDIKKVLAIAASSTIIGVTSVSAADFSDPTWPCVQRKVENLSLGLLWPYPIDADAPFSDQQKAAVADLADRLTLRRIDLEDLEGTVAAFAESVNGDSTMLGHVYERVFAALSKRRTRIINGIGDFSLSQIALAEKIDATRLEMDTLLGADDPDYDKIDSLEEQLDWDQIIYTDRQHSITYLCETPVLLEKRLYAISQMLIAVRAEDG